MPELPEVEVIARGLAKRLADRTVAAVDLRRADIVRGAAPLLALPLAGCRVDQVRRAGKLIRFDFYGAITLHVHLGMTGRLLLADANDRLEPHTHCRLTFMNTALELRHCDPRRFGGIWISNGESDAAWHGRRLPPIAEDPLAISLPRWRLLLRRNRQIKALLLDQQPISGIGNIYCDEALHRAGIHPLSIAGQLAPEAVDALYRSIRRVLREAIAAGGSSISDYRDADNQRGTFHKKHRVYDRAGKPCRRCGASIERFVIAGRGTHLCPKCQPR